MQTTKMVHHDGGLCNNGCAGSGAAGDPHGPLSIAEHPALGSWRTVAPGGSQEACSCAGAGAWHPALRAAQACHAVGPQVSGLSLRHLPVVYLELAKARLTALVVVTTAVGFVLAGAEPVHWDELLWAVVGTALAGAGANGLNQCLEARHDARMPRTCRRPVAVGRISRQHAMTWSIGTAAGGVALLLLGVNLLTAVLGALAVELYALVYTPLKQHSSACTLVGAVVGALPPVMGWTAASGSIGEGAWILGAILFVWQIPHSLALAWLYREDYAKGGYHILTWNDPDGRKTFDMIVLYSLCLVPVSLALHLVGLAGSWYALGAIVLGGWLVVLAARLQRRGRDADARRLFLATVVHLPLLLGLMLMDRV